MPISIKMKLSSLTGQARPERIGPLTESPYQLCLEATQGITKWLAFLDIDEFIVPLRDNSLIEFLREHEEHAIVIAYWRIFGTSYLAEIPPNTLLTEYLTRTHPPLSQGELCFGKPIAKPHLVNYINIHSGHSNSRSTYYCHPGYAHNWNRGKVTATAQIRNNHGSTRDEKFLFSTKQERRERYEGKPWSPRKIALLRKAYNDEEDLAIFRSIPQLRERCGASFISDKGTAGT